MRGLRYLLPFRAVLFFLRLKEIKGNTEEPYMGVSLLTSVQHLTATLRTLS